MSGLGFGWKSSRDTHPLPWHESKLLFQLSQNFKIATPYILRSTLGTNRKQALPFSTDGAQSQKGPLDFRTSTRSDFPFLAKMLRKLITRTTNPTILLVSSIGCSVILGAGNWALLLIERCQNCDCVLDLFSHDRIFAKPRTKMTTVSSFPTKMTLVCARSLWENLVFEVVLVLESKVLHY